MEEQKLLAIAERAVAEFEASLSPQCPNDDDDDWSVPDDACDSGGELAEK